MMVPSRSRIATRVHFTLSHFVGDALQLRVADEQVPDDGREALGVRRHPLGGDRRDEDARVGRLLREAAVAPDDAVHLGADLARELEATARG